MSESNQHENVGDCKTGDCGGMCMICNLFICKHCGLYEGALTTDCPRVHVSSEDSDRIYSKGDLDYRGNAWVNAPNPTNQDFLKWGKEA